MTVKRILVRLAFWAAVFVVHLLFIRWASEHLMPLLIFDGPRWLVYVIAYTLYFPIYIFPPLGVFPPQGVPAPMSLAGWAEISALWTVTVAAAFEGARWLWAIRPGRRRPFHSRESDPAQTGYLAATR